MSDDYRCQHCGNNVLYRSDHQPTCQHYPARDWSTAELTEAQP